MAEKSSHTRHSIRLPDYDYSNPGGYFVTICVQNRECLLGNVKDGEIILNDAGKMIQKWWICLTDKFNNIEIDEYAIMPNHFHGVIFLKDTTVGADQQNRPSIKKGKHVGLPLPRMIQWFKTMTTNEYYQNVKEKAWPPVDRRLWQRNYYEHIIRNEKDLYNARKYILENPLKWDEYEFYCNTR